MFELGEAPEDTGLSPELVVVEADGTFLAAQKEEGDRFEVKTGVFYTGKDRAGGRRHRRWKLLNKGCYATTADADAFGRGLAARGFHWIGLHRARHVLCVHDGLDEYGQTFSDWFPHAPHHQIDHFHVAERIWQVSGADATIFENLKRLAFSDPVACAKKLRRSRRLSLSSSATRPATSRASPATFTVWTDCRDGSAEDGCAWWAPAWSRSTRTYS